MLWCAPASLECKFALTKKGARVQRRALAGTRRHACTRWPHPAGEWHTAATQTHTQPVQVRSRLAIREPVLSLALSCPLVPPLLSLPSSPSLSPPSPGAHKHTHARTHARTHAHTRAHAHTHKYNGDRHQPPSTPPPYTAPMLMKNFSRGHVPTARRLVPIFLGPPGRGARARDSAAGPRRACNGTPRSRCRRDRRGRTCGAVAVAYRGTVRRWRRARRRQALCALRRDAAERLARDPLRPRKPLGALQQQARKQQETNVRRHAQAVRSSVGQDA